MKKERQLVMEAILEMGYLPAGMEYFISDDAQQFEIIKRWIKESDAYLLIVGGRYGSENPFDSQRRSYTHLEFEYARKIKKPIKILRLSNSFIQIKKSNGDYTEDDLINPKLIDFRKNLPMSNNVTLLSDVKSVTKTLLGSLKMLERNDNCGWIKSNDIAPLIQLHPNNVDLARSKSIKGDYNIYYYSVYHSRYVHSILSLNIKNKTLISTLKNDIDAEGNCTYTYNGKFEIFDDFLYLELKSSTDNEKLFAMIKLLPGKLKLSMGIIVGQGTSKQAAATTFIISRDIISFENVLEEFRQDQVCQFSETEKLLIDDESIKFLTDNLAEYQKTSKSFEEIK